jgi:redox-sensing transcriptional repressor
VKPVKANAIGRLSLYRRLLGELSARETLNLFSHELARMAGVTAAQVRRDIMGLGYSGTPTKGYNVRQLTESIGEYLDEPTGQKVALVGIGNLGRAILAYFSKRRPRLEIVAAFDTDLEKIDRLIHGCPCYSMLQMPAVIDEKCITVGIITVPAASAQEVADRLVAAGVSGILNFAPVPLRVRQQVYVEHVDMTMSLEKVAYFARRNLSVRRNAEHGPG